MSEDAVMHEAQDIIIGFLMVREADGAFRGGLLITDATGIPLELRATDSIRPTLTQRIAYGGSLSRAVATLCGRPLLDALQERPTLVLAHYKEFLSLHSPELPVICVEPHGEQLDLDTNDSTGTEDVLEAPSAEFQFVKLGFARRLGKEDKAALRDQVTHIYQDLGLNILEPFGRIEHALELLDKQGAEE